MKSSNWYSLLFIFSLFVLITACKDDDDDMTPTPVDPEVPVTPMEPAEPTVSVPNFVAYNSGMNPLLPEGIEFDYAKEAFIISSAAGAGINLVALDGSVSNLVAPTIFAGNGIFGLQTDRINDRLLAVSANLQNPAIANLFIFNLSDGAMLHNVDLSTLSPGLNFVNDVAVDLEGNAYVSNSDQGIIFKVDMEGNASIFFNDASFAPADP